jgi:hypothetical protein
MNPERKGGRVAYRLLPFVSKQGCVVKFFRGVRRNQIILE